MILRRAQNDSLGLLDFLPQTENVLWKLRFVTFPVAENQLVFAQVDEFGIALQFLCSLQGQRNGQRGITSRAKASGDAHDFAGVKFVVGRAHFGCESKG